MSGIDIFAWLVVGIIVATVAIIVAVLGGLPGKVARQRQHPQTEAIQLASWLALIFGFALWPVVLVWAYVRPVARPVESTGESSASGEVEGEDPSARIAELEARITKLESVMEGAPER